jgi:hypothetical protein
VEGLDSEMGSQERIEGVRLLWQQGKITSHPQLRGEKTGLKEVEAEAPPKTLALGNGSDPC